MKNSGMESRSHTIDRSQRDINKNQIESTLK